MNRFIDELKRRSVFKVAVAYLVVGWVLLQVADIIAPILGLPPTAQRFVLFLLVVLFPIALFLAWAFDIRPAEGDNFGTSPAKTFVPVAASVLVLGAVSFALLFGRQPPETGGERPPIPAGSAGIGGASDQASLAVLPFTDLSPEGDQQYFGDGIADAVLSFLTRTDGLSVASRQSAFVFKEENRNLSDIAGVLDVAFVLDGTLRKAGSRISITAQLVDARTDRNLWSASFARELTVENVFAIQDDIATAIVAALSEELGLELRRDSRLVPSTGSLDAYDLFLQAQQLQAIASTDNIRRQVQMAERVVELDPSFSEAWAWLAQWLVWLPTWDQTLDAPLYHERAVDAAERALELDPLSPTAWNALAQAHHKANDWEAWDDAIRRARARIPDFRRDPADVMGLGYLTDATEIARERASEGLDGPLSELLQGLRLEAIGQGEAAIELIERAILRGYNGGAEWNLAAVYWDLGETSVWTSTWAREFLANDPELLTLLPHMRDLLLASAADRPRAAARFRAVARELGFEMEHLVRLGPRFGTRVPREVAVALGRSDVVAEGFWTNYPKFWMWSKSLHDFRQSDAFRQSVRESGMLAYWRSHGWPDLCRPAATDDFECD